MRTVLQQHSNDIYVGMMMKTEQEVAVVNLEPFGLKIFQYKFRWPEMLQLDVIESVLQLKTIVNMIRIVTPLVTIPSLEVVNKHRETNRFIYKMRIKITCK